MAQKKVKRESPVAGHANIVIYPNLSAGNIGVKLVPRFPLNVFYGVTKLPSGVFGVMTKLDRIGRKDFVEGNAQFVFGPVEFEE